MKVLTIEEWKELELDIPEQDKLYIESGLEWLKDNTILNFEVANIESIKALPAGAKLFLKKYCDLTKRDSSIASESIGGTLSQSFFNKDINRIIESCARQMLKKYLKPTVKFYPCMKRWK